MTDRAAILLRTRADAGVGLERDHDLMHQGLVVVAAEHGVVRVHRAVAVSDELEFHDYAFAAGAGLAAGFSGFAAGFSAFGAALGA